ncbi:vomeronasal type-2 receptor 116-like [Peromyscus leucopus]|uniref:vomeronasal type-2 receptor 116-like n=1 Tax=Peromyscus leucopus TaxID=10041 RepID=UPI001884C544|nr:vomeronasal type-2 receptor 116-like [Peromyscus leucopus]
MGAYVYTAAGAFPYSATCILQQITIGVLFTVAVSTVLAKTIIVLLAFTITAPERRYLVVKCGRQSPSWPPPDGAQTGTKGLGQRGVMGHHRYVEKCVRCPEDQYANREQTQCIPKSLVFLTYEDPLGMTLASISLCFSAFTVLVLVVFVKNHDTPLVKANNQNLSYILLISLMFCFLCPLLFIGHPSSATCILQQITFGVVFTVAISMVLAKTVTVLLAFIVIAPGRRMRFFIISRAPNYIIVICTLIQIILCAIWLGVSPPSIDTDAHSEYGQIIIVCNKGSVTAFYCVLGYHGSLALTSFIVAFLARNLPDKFNEAKLLTFSMLLFCSVWITFLPVFHSTKGKVMVVVEVFYILSSSAGLLGCIFIPKCYIISFRPERNSLQKLREKSSS